jgi:hypothetical protein
MGYNNGLVIEADIHGDEVVGTVYGYGVHKGQFVVDILVKSEEFGAFGRFVYLDQVKGIAGNRYGEELSFQELRHLKEGTPVQFEDKDTGKVQAAKISRKNGSRVAIQMKNRREFITLDNVDLYKISFPVGGINV